MARIRGYLLLAVPLAVILFFAFRWNSIETYTATNPPQECTCNCVFPEPPKVTCECPEQERVEPVQPVCSTPSLSVASAVPTNFQYPACSSSGVQHDCPEPNEKPMMAQTDIDLFRRTLERLDPKTSIYVEFGSGSSTIFAEPYVAVGYSLGTSVLDKIIHRRLSCRYDLSHLPGTILSRIRL